jgi:ubiquinone biosynthesis protein
VRISSILKGPRRVRRVAHIAQKAAKHGLGFALSRLDLQRYLPPWLRLPRPTVEVEPEDLAPRLAAVLEELGPTFVKFGQMLSTRPDILPPAYIAELERICHHVTPFPGEKAKAIVTEALGAPLPELFREFADEPFASGSMAQIHEAVLPDGTPVVVKVRRPMIEQVIEDDIAIMAFIAAQADKVEELAPFRIPMLVDEFGRGITSELDFVAEAAYTHKFREGLSEEGSLEVPRVFWDYTTERVLTLERMTGTHLSEHLGAERGLADPGRVARILMDAYLRQFFILGAFHADPHPGNILLTDTGHVALLDFGLVGRLSSALRRDMGVCIMALGNGQVDLVAEVLTEMGRPPSEALREECREELVALLDRDASVPIEKLDFRRSFQAVMGVIRKYRLEVPRDFVLMGRALVVISGIVTQLDPRLNVASLAAPYGSRLLRERLAPSSIKRTVTTGGYHAATLAGDAPRQIRRILQKLQGGLFEFTIRHEGFEKGLAELDQTGNRLSLSIILAAIIIASASLLTEDIGSVHVLGVRVSILGLVGLVFGFVLGIWLIVGILRSRRV